MRRALASAVFLAVAGLGAATSLRARAGFISASTMSSMMPAPIAGRGVGFGRARIAYENAYGPGERSNAPWRATARSMSHTTTGQGCNLNVISVRESAAGEGTTPYTALYHLGWFTGLDQVKQCSVPPHDFEQQGDKLPDTPTNCRQDASVQGRMMNPFNLPLRDANSHYLSCSDGRAQYGVIGSPGGDAAEFIHGLNALEAAIHMPLTPDGVAALLREFLEYMPSFGKQYMYMHTDREAHDRLHQAAGVSDPPNPLDAPGRLALVKLSAEPAHVGCSHLRSLLEDEAGFGGRANVTRAFIQAYTRIFHDPFDKYRERLVYPVLHGERAEKAVVNVASPEVCAPLTPLVVPQLHSAQPTLGADIMSDPNAFDPLAAAFGSSGAGAGSDAGGSGSGASARDGTVGTSVFVHHYVAAAEFRMRIAEFLAPKYGLDPSILAGKMNRIAREFYKKTVAKEMGGKPVYNVMFGP